MVAANEAVARELTRHRVPMIFRVHAPPSPEKIEGLTAELVELGYHPGNLTKRRNLATLLKTVKEDPLAAHVNAAVLRSMNRAEYSAEHGEHFGLAVEFYGHFTSPIRRYPDLILHRQLGALLRTPGSKAPRGSTRTGYRHEELSRIASSCSQTEQAADEAERALIELKKYRALARELESDTPTVYDAAVVNVTNFGLFVELLELQIQGLVHVSALSDRFVRYGRRTKRLHAGRISYGLGSRMRVFVTGVDLDKRRIDFGLVRD